MNAAEVLAVAERIETAYGLKAAGARLRRAAGVEHDPEKVAPLQDRGGAVRSIPWGLHEFLHRAYGHDQTAERLAERGGFSRSELGLLAVGTYKAGGREPSRGFERTFPLLDLYEAARGAGVMP